MSVLRPVAEDVWEELVTEGIATVRARDGAQWHLGDLAARVEVTYAEHDIDDYGEAIGVSASTLRRYRDVARAYEPATRVADVSWSHHRLVAARDDRLDWLEQARAGGWSRRRLESELAAATPIPSVRTITVTRVVTPSSVTHLPASRADEPELAERFRALLPDVPPEAVAEVARLGLRTMRGTPPHEVVRQLEHTPGDLRQNAFMRLSQNLERGIWSLEDPNRLTVDRVDPQARADLISKAPPTERVRQSATLRLEIEKRAQGLDDILNRLGRSSFQRVSTQLLEHDRKQLRDHFERARRVFEEALNELGPIGTGPRA